MEPTASETHFQIALDEALSRIREITRRHPVCPRCFVELLRDRLEDLLRNDPTLGHIRYGDDEDPIGPVEGHA